MAAGPLQEVEVSYELYREIAEELCVPVDASLSPAVRYELYQSKLVYLKNLYDQAFRAANLSRRETHFTHEDLKMIHAAIEATKGFLRATVKESVVISLAKVA